MKRKNIKLIIKEHFLLNPNATLRVREIERLLQLSLPSVITYCKELKKEGILMTRTIGRVTLYTASRNETYRREKQLHNLKQLQESGLIEHLRITLSNPTLILFGSYARGEDTEESDIDLYVETPSKREPDLKKYETYLHRRIQLFRHERLADIKNKHLANNIINGITLNGRVEVFT